MSTRQPLNEAEAAKRDLGEIWLSTQGEMVQPFRPFQPPTGHTYVRIDEVLGSWVGRRVIRQRDDRKWDRGWYVIGAAMLGANLGDAPRRDGLYVPVVQERAWWAWEIARTPIAKPDRWIATERLWLDESEDPAPR